MRFFCTLFSLFLLSSALHAQQAPAYWRAADGISVQSLAPESPMRPTAFKAFQLDEQALRQHLAAAPMEFSGAAGLEVRFPNADGVFRTFKVWESPVCHPDLTAKYPLIRTFAGKATDGSGDVMRFDVGYKGLNAFVFSIDGNIQSLVPAPVNAPSTYMAYRLEDLPSDRLVASAAGCGVEETEQDFFGTNYLPSQNQTAERGGAAPVTLKKYRIAVAGKGEYTQFHGGTVPSALSAIVTAVNFIVAITERDMALRLELIANNDQIIFLDPATDPYTGNEAGGWMAQNAAAINPIIGSGSYDVGHVFSVYQAGSAAGIAQLSSVCGINKAFGCSTQQAPVGEYFYLTAAHELGHQHSGTHTFNQCQDDSQFTPGSSWETGSGTTILAYGGLCGPNNVGGDNDPYYHTGTISQFLNFMYNENGNNCGTVETTDNNPPTATILHPNGFFIPISTPFELKGEATDPDGDELTYCWEQFDLGPTSPLGTPAGNGPVFRSISPTTSPSRIFPRNANIINNINSSTEILPTYTRTFKFRLTVRDNHPGAGGVDIKDMNFNATEQAGPFRVTYPNLSSVVWKVGEYQIVTWDVANTDLAPVNCKNVTIRLSIGGGNSFPVVLAENVPNTGSACVLVPDNVTNFARVRITAADNIFFDMSNTNFKIEAATTPAFTLCNQELEANACIPETFTTTISTSAVAGFDTLVQLSVNGLPAGVEATFTPNPVVPGNDAVLSIVFPAGQAEGTFDYTVLAQAGTQIDSINLKTTVVDSDFAAFALESPSNGASGVVQTPVLRWNGVPAADGYEIQVATSPSFEPGTLVTNVTNGTIDTLKMSTILEKGTVYYWRVRPINDCGTADWSEVFLFGTLIESCSVFVANDLPKNISASSTPTIESIIAVPGGGIVSDVNVKQVRGNHQFLSDLEVTLVAPSGATVQLFKSKCPGFNGSFNMGFDDSAISSFSCPPPNNGNTAKPSQLLSSLNGINSGGNWTLRVKDNVVSSGGQLTGFEIELCSSASLNPPFIVNNNPLVVNSGTNAVIGSSLLLADDSDNVPADLTYTLVSLPVNGHLEREWTGPMKAGDQFTQAQLDAGQIRYFDYGFANADAFRFVVADPDGGFETGVYNVQVNGLSTGDPRMANSFLLSPNPTTDMIRLQFSNPLGADTRAVMFNSTGQLIRTWILPQGLENTSFNLPALPEGWYVLNVEGLGARKVIVRR